jgi:CheY-like chemotaxis protein
LELQLERYDIVCDKAMNGSDAVKCFKKDREKQCCNRYYKLVLMDLNMPEMDGYEATR